MCLHLDSTGKVVILEESEVEAGVRAEAGEASSQVREWQGFACICKCLFMSCMQWSHMHDMCSSVPMAIWKTSVWEGLVDALTNGGYEGMEDYPFCIAFLHYIFALYAFSLSHISFTYAVHPY